MHQLLDPDQLFAEAAAGMRAGEVFLGEAVERRVEFRRGGAFGPQRIDGRQDVPPLEGAAVWVMPSPSGRAAAYRGRIQAVLAERAAALGRETVP
jgi:hypothetical protein